MSSLLRGTSSLCLNAYKILLMSAASFSLATLSPSVCLGRDSGVKATIEAREGYDSNTNRTSDDKISAWETKITPGVAFDSKGVADTFTLAYSPSYVKNHETHAENLDHHLRVSEHAQLVSNWLLELSEKYIQTDDAAENTDTAFLNSTKLKRNRFANNIANLNSTVVFGPNSSLGLGYTNTILENDAEDQADYIRHEPGANLSWQISPQLQTNLSYRYSYGDFDTISTLNPQDPLQPQDIETHTAGISIGVSPTTHSKISVSYQFVGMNFTSQNATPDRESYRVHSGNLRLDQVVTPATSVGLFFGPSRVDRHDSGDDNDYNYGFELNSKLQNGKFLLSGVGGVDQLYFNGTNDGLTIYWSAMSSLNYQLTKNFALAISGSVRRDKFIDQQPKGHETNYAGRLELAYAWQWVSAAISGQYYELKTDSESTTTDKGYDGYRFYCTLSAGKELLRWL